MRTPPPPTHPTPPPDPPRVCTRPRHSMPPAISSLPFLDLSPPPPSPPPPSSRLPRPTPPRLLALTPPRSPPPPTPLTNPSLVCPYAVHLPLCCTSFLYVYVQLVDELLAFWSLEDYEERLEELEEVLIVSGQLAVGSWHSQFGGWPVGQLS